MQVLVFAYIFVKRCSRSFIIIYWKIYGKVKRCTFLNQRIKPNRKKNPTIFKTQYVNDDATHIDDT